MFSIEKLKSYCKQTALDTETVFENIVDISERYAINYDKNIYDNKRGTSVYHGVERESNLPVIFHMTQTLMNLFR